ncbi:hypothetical protein LZ496_00260 [Sphingomonas sp. NSE70-1]|uniref:Secreted protein n=1 Tax=Sphingomonas caseinilyticus TaxID=2908205 RepID=A0ABT0RQC0_9SPHN|nr:hypothetical protein [Sphingomonas caseinilyticus]MCL6697224.1 hypothetical protein [Sphingomonas caseinilyticus]
MKRIGSLAFVSTLLVGAIASPLIGQTETRLPPDRPPSLMTPTEIRAFNEGLDATHPYYIRCKKDPVIGSLARKLRVCRTNDEWKRYAAAGNDNGREILDDVIRAPVSGPPALDACPNNRC